ncbi:flagellar hook-associated protein 2 [Chitinivorax tropicus]|uniref:Flagellar hook-associated protein 2 n=1 Tax=Chitinivorax tropicus TaxID=714531 RepID=A0A840MN16_9PROT|nr:flagellar filament capping protein FliD [Chitinivorax tropicus]MBB5018357.1 flagellar hook-associated protein 2 [Chitinivorax tropicus]
MIGSIYNSSGLVGLYTSRGLLQPSDYLRDSEISRIGGRGVSLSAAGNDLNRAVESTQVRLSNVGKLRSALDTFRSDLNALSSQDKVAPLRAQSSDESVAKTGTPLPQRVRDDPRVEVVVSQVATAQVLQSQAFNDKDSTIVGTGSLTIQAGSFSDANGTFTPTQTPATTVNITANTGTLEEVARRINTAQAGVSAEVIRGDDGFRLQITASPGTSNSLQITTQDNDGNDSDTNGLSRLAFDPAAAAAAGQNLLQTVTPGNTEVTLNERRLSSANTGIQDIVSGIRLDIQNVGTASITIGRDLDRFKEAAKQFVSSINTLEQGLADQQADRLTNRSLSQVRSQLTEAASGFGLNRQTLSDIGITRDETGKLVVDEGKVGTAFVRDPDSASRLLSQTAAGLRDQVSGSLAPQSELNQTGQSLERALTSLETRRTARQLANSQVFYGLPAQQASSLFNYVPRQGSPVGAARYLSVASS